MQVHGDSAWLQRLSAAESAEALGQVMSEWFAEIKHSSHPSGSLGFEFYMQAGNWQAAKGSLEQSYGRGGGMHQNLVAMLGAAIQHRKFLSMRA